MIRAVLFDFGGVLADEGFREGLKAIGRKNGIDQEDFFATASELIYKTGYVVGMAHESEYWDTIRKETGIIAHDDELRNEILKRFVLRPKVLHYVDKTKAAGLVTALLSDQTNWLDEINQQSPFFNHFDHIFNSFNLHKGKRDSSIFSDVCTVMGLKPEEVLFIDDNIDNIKRAHGERLHVIHFESIESFAKKIKNIIG
jgi:putative hydrolase of the HAD superfamily